MKTTKKEFTPDEAELLRRILNDHLLFIRRSKVVSHLSGNSQNQITREVKTVESIISKI